MTGKDQELRIISSGLQVRFWARLQLLRNEFLSEALTNVVKQLDVTVLDAELARYVGKKRLGALAAYSLRGEILYPVPLVLSAKPSLLGYYRLLYGVSQKEFYQGGLGKFQRMEKDNTLSESNAKQLPHLCTSLIETGWELFQGIQPLSRTVIHELQLLTIGPQLRGSENNTIGQGAVRAVFDLMRQLLRDHVESSTATVINVRNAAGRMVQIIFSPDPDIAIIELMDAAPVPLVSVEIKGGTDVSNVHNRIGEAEKSHQKAKANGFTQFWSIIKARMDDRIARSESPTTTAWFNLNDILQESSPQQQVFRDRVFQVVGVY